MSINESKIIASISLDAILERVKIDSGAKNDSQVSVVLGTSRANLSAWRKRQMIPYENLYAYAISHQVDFNWLMFGDNSVIKSRHPYQVAESPAHYYHSLRAQRLCNFLHDWMRSHNDDEQAWLEIDFKQRYPDYVIWLDSNEDKT